MQPFEHLLKKLDGTIINQDFAEQVHLTIQLPKQNLMALSEAFTGLYSA
jgi:putative IMPACT (imprinted ancient) family translation regulator